jgi:hypothetical protein
MSNQTMFRGTARYMANERPLAAYRFGPAVVSFGSPAAVRALWKQPLGCRRVHAMWPVAALAALAAKVGYDVLAPGLPGCCLTEVPGPGWRALRRPGGAGGLASVNHLHVDGRMLEVVLPSLADPPARRRGIARWS